MGLLKKYNDQLVTGGGLSYNSNSPNFPDPKEWFDEENPSTKTITVNTFDKTNLDLENAAPFGGPNNFPSYNHTQKWLPQDGKGFADSAEGQIRGDGKLQTTFDQTDLDLTNPSPLGGPINIPYTTRVGFRTVSKTTTQPYLPQNGKTYTDSLQDPLLIARATDPFK